MTYKDKRYHFYRCADERFVTGHSYFNHTNGIAGFDTLQSRRGYIGHLTIDELDKELNRQKHLGNAGGINGHKVRAGNVTRNYSSRY